MAANHFVLHLVDASKVTETAVHDNIGTDPSASSSSSAFKRLPPLPVCVANSAADISDVKPIILFAKNAIEPYVREGKIIPSHDLISWLKHVFASMWILLRCSPYAKDCWITVLNHMLPIVFPRNLILWCGRQMEQLASMTW